MIESILILATFFSNEVFIGQLGQVQKYKLVMKSSRKNPANRGVTYLNSYCTYLGGDQ